MLLLSEKSDVRDSTQAIRYCEDSLLQKLREGAHNAIAVTDSFGPGFSAQDSKRHVSRDPGSAVIHEHETHVLLMRSSEHVGDDTIICDLLEGMRALARAAVRTEIVAKLRAAGGRSDQHTNTPLDATLNGITRGFAFLEAGLQTNTGALLRRGRATIRGAFTSQSLPLRGKIEFDVWKTFVLGQQEIPPEKREVLRWDQDKIEAALIAAGSGHGRSLLDCDPDAPPLNLAKMVGAEPSFSHQRGLHFETFQKDHGIPFDE